MLNTRSLAYLVWKVDEPLEKPQRATLTKNVRPPVPTILKVAQSTVARALCHATLIPATNNIENTEPSNRVGNFTQKYR